MYEILDRTTGGQIALRVSGRLTESDLQDLRPYLEGKAEAQEALSLLLWMDDWQGWESISALWEDMKTDLDISDDIERLALVSNANWERWMAHVTEPVLSGDVRSYGADELEEAWTWVREDRSTA